MGFTVKEIQPTPNPNAAKFVLDGEISEQPLSFLSPEQGRDHPLAAQLFAINGVTSVLLLGDFVTVNKAPEVQWSLITSKVQEILQNVAPGGRFSKRNQI
jgi:hypothetical protein